MLFIIAIEVLAQKISNSKEIEGIKIQNNKTVKLSQYADDTTVFLANVHSVNNLFVLFSRFEKCAGLKINVSKSEMLWLCSMRHRKDKILNLQMTDEPVYALGPLRSRTTTICQTRETSSTSCQNYRRL